MGDELQAGAVMTWDDPEYDLCAVVLGGAIGFRRSLEVSHGVPHRSSLRDARPKNQHLPYVLYPDGDLTHRRDDDESHGEREDPLDGPARKYVRFKVSSSFRWTLLQSTAPRQSSALALRACSS